MLPIVQNILKRKWWILGIVLVLTSALAIGLSIYFTKTPKTSSVQSESSGDSDYYHWLLQFTTDPITNATTSAITSATSVSLETNSGPLIWRRNCLSAPSTTTGEVFSLPIISYKENFRISRPLKI